MAARLLRVFETSSDALADDLPRKNLDTSQPAMFPDENALGTAVIAGPDARDLLTGNAHGIFQPPVSTAISVAGREVFFALPLG
jgi:hypothetical protein